MAITRGKSLYFDEAVTLLKMCLIAANTKLGIWWGSSKVKKDESKKCGVF